MHTHTRTRGRTCTARLLGHGATRACSAARQDQAPRQGGLGVERIGGERSGVEWKGVERREEERRGEERRGVERSGVDRIKPPVNKGGYSPVLSTRLRRLSLVPRRTTAAAHLLCLEPRLSVSHSVSLFLSLSLSLAPALSRPRPGGHGGALPAPRVSMNSTFESTCMDGSIRAKAHALKCKHIHPNGGTCIRSALPAPRVRYTRTVVNAHESTSNQVEAHPSAAHCPL